MYELWRGVVFASCGLIPGFGRIVFFMSDIFVKNPFWGGQVLWRPCEAFISLTFRVTQRPLFISETWYIALAQPGKRCITIELGMAFCYSLGIVLRCCA